MEKYIALLKAVEVGSFTKAAELFGLYSAGAQSDDSVFEKTSVKLLCRSRYGAALTPEGKRLYPSIQSNILQYGS